MSTSRRRRNPCRVDGPRFRCSPRLSTHFTLPGRPRFVATPKSMKASLQPDFASTHPSTRELCHNLSAFGKQGSDSDCPRKSWRLLLPEDQTATEPRQRWRSETDTMLKQDGGRTSGRSRVERMSQANAQTLLAICNLGRCPRRDSAHMVIATIRPLRICGIRPARPDGPPAERSRSAARGGCRSRYLGTVFGAGAGTVGSRRDRV